MNTTSQWEKSKNNMFPPQAWQDTKETPEARKEQIIGWLNAYRNGWVSYDREHVLSLKAELIALA
jgi:hypothetical protein